MIELRGYMVSRRWPNHEEWRCISCGKAGPTIIEVHHSDECQWNGEIMGLAYNRDRIEKILDAAFEKRDF